MEGHTRKDLPDLRGSEKTTGMSLSNLFPLHRVIFQNWILVSKQCCLLLSSVALSLERLSVSFNIT